MLSMKNIVTLNKVGFYVADSVFFKQFKQKYPEIESDSFSLLKEWDIIRDSKDVKSDITLLEQYEKKIGSPFLWNALVADRRIYFGKRYAYDQDYRPRFDHERMLSILQVGLRRMENFFNEVEPDFIVSFQCVTLGEYLSYLFARDRGIPILNLRPTRVQNYMYAGESILEPSENLKKTYQRFLNDGIEPSLKREVIRFLHETRSTHSMYEGVVPASNMPREYTYSGKKLLNLLNVKGLIKLLVEEYKYRFGEYRYDTHISGFIGPFFGVKFLKLWRARLMDKRFRDLYVKEKDLPLLNYAFFPLHTEPEVTILVYNKPYLNQIEAIRLFSHNLPIGMKLVVKEHPCSIGKRPLSYYRKILEIPNVLLAHPSLMTRELVLNARLITAIAGSTGLEALILGKPVVILGRAPFEFLPSNMIRHAGNPDYLGNDVQDLLDNYESNEKALQSYIAAVMSDSVPVDFYSKLLARKGVYSLNGVKKGDREEQEKKRVEQINLLARYLVHQLEKFKSVTEQLLPEN